MAIYAIGDVHGCLQELEALLAALAFDPEADRLWFVGDLVNRGPDSLGVMRLVRSLGDRAVTVMGNHELRALRGLAGLDSKGFSRSLAFLEQDPEREGWLAWLSALPLVHWDPELGVAMTHAGLSPVWSLSEALRRSARLSAALTDGEARAELFTRNAGAGLPVAERLDMDEWSLMWRDLAVMTRLRRCDADGVCLWPGGPIDPVHGDPFLPPDPASNTPFRAWHELRAPDQGERVVFGHWAGAGLTVTPRIWGLDSGCVYGGALSAVCLDDPRHPITQVPGTAYVSVG